MTDGIRSWEKHEITPSREMVWSKEQGGAPTLSERLNQVFEEARLQFTQYAKPLSLCENLALSEFPDLFCGEGLNELPSPLEPVFKQAEKMRLFAFTLGNGLSERIENLFDAGDYAVAYLLDSLASRACERAVQLMEQDIDRGNPAKATLGYSPGYCGWHISAQGKLFKKLHPEKIGIHLNESFLMIPLKSVSGVLVSGDRPIHRLERGFRACQTCRNPSCIERMRSLNIDG